MIFAREYADFLDTRYLAPFIAGGGAAVKFVVAEDHTALGFAKTLKDSAQSRGMATFEVSAQRVQVNLIEQLYFAVAREIPWMDLAEAQVRAVWAKLGWPISAGEPLTVEKIAAAQELPTAEVARDFKRELSRQVLSDHTLVREFRTAMFRICMALAEPGTHELERDSALAWLRGETVLASLLKKAGLYRKIDKSNGRVMLSSALRWHQTRGQRGSVLVVDLRRVNFARAPSPAERDGLYYTNGKVIDVWEITRQFIDNTEEITGALVLFVVAPAFLEDAKRGIESYPALRMRLVDDVHDRVRPNPFSSLVQLGYSENA